MSVGLNPAQYSMTLGPEPGRGKAMDGTQSDVDVGTVHTVATTWPTLDGWSDRELLAACRDGEFERRRSEGHLIIAMMELERRKLYLDDGYRCLAEWGRGAQRWSDVEARSRRDLVKLASAEPVIVDRLLAGRVGVAQVHLLGRLSRAPRVGRLVPYFLREFLDQAAALSFADFEEYVRNWRLLADQEGADPAHAHRDRSVSVGFTDHEFRMVVTGPAIDGVQWHGLLRQVERIEWERDWEATVRRHGDGANASLMPRTPAQRRYDAFCSLLAHIGRSPTGPGEANGAQPGSGVVVNIVVDAHTFARGVDDVFGACSPDRISPPFGPDAAFCHTFDGTFVAPRDAVLAGLAGKVRMMLADESGQVVKMTKTGRLFVGAMRDAVLAAASRCTHPGCLVAATDCQIDHVIPYSNGGPTSVINANGACRHHNRWRYESGARVERLPDGSWATYRRDGTRVAPPD
jgi:hypothetical protein